MKGIKIAKKKGFTLVELIVTIAIIAILATMVGIAASFFMKESKEKTQKTSIETAYNSIQALIAESNSGFSMTGQIDKDTCKEVLDDDVIDFQLYYYKEKYSAPVSSSTEGYYIVLRNDCISTPGARDEAYLDLLYYVKNGNVWSYVGGTLYKNGALY